MASCSTSTLLLSFKLALMSIGALSLAVSTKLIIPLVLQFSRSELPAMWSSFSMYLKPPYLYVLINFIIITIAASSRLYNNKEEQQQHESTESSTEEKANIVEKVHSFLYNYEFQKVEENEVMEVSGEEKVGKMDENDAFVIRKSEWTPPKRMESTESMESSSPAEKPLVSARFGHRKSPKTSPEGVRALRVAKPKKHDTLENTWKTITEGRPMPLKRHFKKCDTWENHGREMNASCSPDPTVMKKSETFKDRTNEQVTPVKVTRREPSLSQDELNRRVEAFIKKFNEEMRMQRQQSVDQYRQMISGK